MGNTSLTTLGDNVKSVQPQFITTPNLHPFNQYHPKSTSILTPSTICTLPATIRETSRAATEPPSDQAMSLGKVDGKHQRQC